MAGSANELAQCRKLTSRKNSIIVGSMKKYTILFVVLLSSAVFYKFFTLASESKKAPDTIGIENDMLRKCGSKPNCVSSMDSREDHFIAPLKFSESFETRRSTFAKLKEIVLTIPGYSLESESENYLHFTEKTKIFGFVDDLELHLSSDLESIAVRSASRVGTSDLGVNRKRVEDIRERFSKLANSK